MRLTWADVTDRIQTATDLALVDADQLRTLTLLSVLRSLYFAAMQTCGSTQVHWDGIPGPNQVWHDLPHPAPALNLTGGADDMAGMHH